MRVIYKITNLFTFGAKYVIKTLDSIVRVYMGPARAVGQNLQGISAVPESINIT